MNVDYIWLLYRIRYLSSKKIKKFETNFHFEVKSPPSYAQMPRVFPNGKFSGTVPALLAKVSTTAQCL